VIDIVITRRIASPVNKVDTLDADAECVNTGCDAKHFRIV
jgi:hypothetical protein